MRGPALERLPRRRIALLVALLGLVAGNAAIVGHLALRPGPDDLSADLPRPTVSPVPATPTADAMPVLAVYGDGYASGSELGGRGAAGWPALVAQQIDGELVLHAVPGAGYAADGDTGQSFVDVVRAGPVPDATVTLVVGSRDDGDQDPDDVQALAATVYEDIRAAAADTTIVVVGPMWTDGAPPAGVLAARDAVKAAADDAGLTFVDPLRAGWFATGDGLIAPDGSPTDAGHSYLATQIAPLVAEALAGARAG